MTQTEFDNTKFYYGCTAKLKNGNVFLIGKADFETGFLKLHEINSKRYIRTIHFIEVESIQ